MDLSYVCLYITVIFFAVPERFIYEIGFDPNNLNIFVYLLFWLLSGLIVHCLIIFFSRIKKTIFN